MFRQPLGAVIAPDINTGSGTEHIELVKRESFSGKVPLLTSYRDVVAKRVRAYINERQEVSM